MDGHKLGLFKALQVLGHTDPASLARHSNTNERYIKEWLECMAAGEYIEHDTESGKFAIPTEHALALTRQDNPHYMAAFLCWIPAMHEMEEKLDSGARVADIGCGYGWSSISLAKGFSKFEVLPVENDFWRFYQLKH